MIRNEKQLSYTPLIHVIEQDVRFSEVDQLGIVWHGHYVQYFEDGREAFGKKYGLGYLDVHEQGYVIPLINIQCDYKKILRYGDRIRIETEYIPTAAAKIHFTYRLYNAVTGDVVVTGTTMQVFLDKESQSLQLVNPAFYIEWKQRFEQAV